MRPRLRRARNFFGLGLRFFRRPRAHFDQQKTGPRRQAVEILERQPLAPHEFNQQVIESFESNGLMFERQRNCVGGEECIAERQHGKHAERRAGGQVECCGDNVDAGALRANQRTRDVEIVLVAEAGRGCSRRRDGECCGNFSRMSDAYRSPDAARGPRRVSPTRPPPRISASISSGGVAPTVSRVPS